MKFTVPPNKDYKTDIKILETALKNKECISFSKFCDGEWSVICNQAIDNKEFWFDPSKNEDQFKRKALIDAFQYKNSRYFVGITCTNVFGLETHRQMKFVCKQNEENLTWADIWVNSNYEYYTNKILPLYKNYQIILFCNKKSSIKSLPFKPHIVFPVEENAWANNWIAIEMAKEVITNDNIKNALFLFCCGPFGNILCHELTKHSEENTYLDIGSTLNPYLQSAGFDRQYYMGNNYFSNMVGAWDQ